MQRRTGWIATILFLSSPAVKAGMIKIWQIKETALAPVLVVGRVVALHKYGRVPDGVLTWKAETWNMTAEIEVLRSSQPIPATRIPVHFLAYGPSVTGFTNGYPPALPQLKLEQVSIFPLQENKNPGVEPWQLTANSGVDLLVPAHAELKPSDSLPPTAYAFLLREIANLFGEGTPAEMSAVSLYLAQQQEDLAGDLLPLMQPVIADQRERWAEVAASVIAAQSIPRQPLATLFSDEPPPLRGNLSIAREALRKLGASPQTEDLLIRTWIANAPFNAWGAANSLAEFAAHQVTTETLRQALRNDVTGSSYIALVIAHKGNTQVLPDALARALRVADQPEGDATDLQGAAALLRDYGSNRDLDQLASLVQKYQLRDKNFYHALWQLATGSENPREARVLAVVLRDRRIVFGDWRYCDYAVGVLDRATGQQFAAPDQPLAQRDEAVARSLAWIKSQGLLN